MTRSCYVRVHRIQTGRRYRRRHKWAVTIIRTGQPDRLHGTRLTWRAAMTDADNLTRRAW